MASRKGAATEIVAVDRAGEAQETLSTARRWVPTAILVQTDESEPWGSQSLKAW